MRKGIIVAIALVIMLSMILTVVPAHAWTYPDKSSDYKYERFGPRLDRIYIPMFDSEDDEWDAMEKGEVDISDWALTCARYTKWAAPPYNETINTVSYGPELGYFLIDINNDNNTEKACPDPDPTKINNPNPIVPPNYPHWNPCADVRFRHALWHAMNRDHVISEIWKGMGYPMTTCIAPALSLAYPPGEGLDTHPFSIDEAKRILDEAGYVDTDNDEWRNYPGGPNIVLIFYARSDHTLRREMAEWYAGILQKELRIKVNLIEADRRTCFYKVMVDKEFHLYTGGWTIGPDPDYLVLYQSYYYWHPGFCYNYGRVNCSEFDEAADHVVMANTIDEAKEWAAKAQVIFNNASIPGALGALFVVSSSGVKSWYKTYTGGAAKPSDEAPYIGKNWTHLVNVPGSGPDSFWTFLNVHPEGYEYGLPGNPMTMRYGFKTLTMEKPSNPVYAEWVWDWAVLGLSYESLLIRDPYTLEWKPWLCKDFEVFTWVDPSDGLTKSGVRFVLRDDVYWSDGTPLTAVDVFWTLVEMDDALMGAGLTPPWWYSNVVYIKSFYMTDPYNIEILLDIKSVWAVGWIGGCIILPKHVWKPLIDCYVSGKEYRPGYKVTDFYAEYVDPDVIATGPYRFVEYVAGDHTLLVANKPGSTVQTKWDYSIPVTSPGYYRYNPVQASIDIVYPPELAYKRKVDAGDWTVNATITNLCLTEDTSVNLKVTYTMPNGTTLTQDYTNIALPAGGKVSIKLPTDFKQYGKHTFKYTIDYNILGKSWHYETPYPSIFYVTIKQDISGSTLHDDIGLPTYPYKKDIPTPDIKVDMKDVGGAARAFGSYPGHPRWWTVADINKDYKVDMKDIGAIARKFGWTG